MNSKVQLFELFDYDLWANLLWLECIGAMRSRARALEIVGHIVEAQQTWLERCLGPEGVPRRSEDVAKALAAANDAWKDLVDVGDLTAYVSYTLRDGSAGMNELGHIALHVVNHGTYHRGQLRGLAEAEGFEGFPETDLIRYFRSMSAKGT